MLSILLTIFILLLLFSFFFTLYFVFAVLFFIHLSKFKIFFRLFPLKNLPPLLLLGIRLFFLFLHPFFLLLLHFLLFLLILLLLLHHHLQNLISNIYLISEPFIFLVRPEAILLLILQFTFLNVCYVYHVLSALLVL